MDSKLNNYYFLYNNLMKYSIDNILNNYKKITILAFNAFMSTTIFTA